MKIITNVFLSIFQHFRSVLSCLRNIYSLTPASHEDSPALKAAINIIGRKCEHIMVDYSTSKPSQHQEAESSDSDNQLSYGRDC